MKKIKIRVIQLGQLNARVDLRRIENWKSDIFELVCDIQKYDLSAKCDLSYWGYSDSLLSGNLPLNQGEDILLSITNVPLEDNWYSRVIDENRIVCTYHETYEILKSENIPLENLILNLLYSYSIAYKAFNNKLPNVYNIYDYVHDETRGCLFDMTGIKTDLIYSCQNAILCEECIRKLKTMRLSEQEIDIVKKEIKRIRKYWLIRFSDLIKTNPVISLIFGVTITIILGALGSKLAEIF